MTCGMYATKTAGAGFVAAVPQPCGRMAIRPFSHQAARACQFDYSGSSPPAPGRRAGFMLM